VPPATPSTRFDLGKASHGKSWGTLDKNRDMSYEKVNITWRSVKTFKGKFLYLQLSPFMKVITGYKWDYTFYEWGYKYL